MMTPIAITSTAKIIFKVDQELFKLQVKEADTV